MYSTRYSCTVPAINVQYPLFMYSTRYSCTVPAIHVQYPLFFSVKKKSRLFSTDIRKNSSNIKFHENLSSVSRVVTCGRTDGQSDRRDEDNSRFSQFCERAWKHDWNRVVFETLIVSLCVISNICQNPHVHCRIHKSSPLINISIPLDSIEIKLFNHIYFCS
jgi:hypothetical protein